jgi:hypothetical protein
MVQPIIQPTDLTYLAKPLCEYREILTGSRQESIKKFDDEDSDISSDKRFPQRTEPDFIGKDKGEAIKTIMPSLTRAGYSSGYIDFNRKTLLNRLSLEISEWITKGTDGSIPNIVNIKRLLEEYSPYLEQSADTRLLLGSLELIFENNSWGDIPKDKLRFFKSNIDYLADNVLDFKKMQTFLKEIHTNKIKILKPGYGQKEEKTEKVT